MLEQGSEEWLRWRKGGLGSSDAPIIMKVSPWKTPRELYEEKISDELDATSTFAMERGHNMEPKARAAYELLYNLDMPAGTKVHPTHEFLRASFDGINEKEKLILEIKCVSKEDHALALKGSVPEKYYPQLQHQLLVTGFDRVHYFSFDGKVGGLVEIKRDDAYLKTLLEEELKFWSFVKTKTPPPYTDRDYVQPEDFMFRTMISDWKMTKRKLTDLELQEKILRNDIENLMPHPRVDWAGVKIQKIDKKGAIEYAKIPELKGVDLEKYRKDGSAYFRFQLETSEEEC